MKKYFEIAMLLTVFILFMISGQAAQALETEIGYISPYAGISYNTFNINGKQWDPGEWGFLEDSAESGMGVFAGARHWFTGKKSLENKAVGAEFDWLSTITLNDDDKQAHIKTFGLLVSGAYDLSEKLVDLPLILSLNAAVGIYQSSIKLEDDKGIIMAETYRGPGIKGGLLASYPIKDNINLAGRVQYRYTQPHSEGNLDYNGFELGLQVDISF